MMSVIRISSGSFFCPILSISISVSSNLVFPLSDSWRFAFYFTLVDKAIWHFFSSTKLNWFLKEFLLRNSCNAQRGRENWGEGGTFFSGEKICSFSGMSCSKSNMILMKFPPLLPPFLLISLWSCSQYLSRKFCHMIKPFRRARGDSSLLIWRRMRQERKRIEREIALDWAAESQFSVVPYFFTNITVLMCLTTRNVVWLPR